MRNWYTSLTIAAALIAQTGCRDNPQKQSQIKQLSIKVVDQAMELVKNKNIEKNSKILRYIGGSYWEITLHERDEKYSGLHVRVWSEHGEETWGKISNDTDGDGLVDDCGLENGGSSEIKGDITPMLPNINYQQILSRALEIIENNQGK